MATTRITASFMIPSDLLAEVDALADAQRLSRSQLLETWIREHIDGEKLNVQLLGNKAVFQAMVQAFSKPDVLKQMAASVGESLNSDQLELFHRALSETHEQAAKVVKKTNTRKKGRRK